VVEFLTLDGVLQGPNSPKEDTDGGFEHGGWSAAYGDEVFYTRTERELADVTAYLLGRRTYQRMAEYWPRQPDENPVAAYFNATPKYVVTRTLTGTHWSGSQVLEGDLAESVNDLKAQGDGAIAVLGSSVLVRSLIELNLVDEFRLFVHPLVLGTGKRLFEQTPHPLRMRLTDCTVTTTGVALLYYDVLKD
jgi:dihydrofolate reductase